MNHRLRGEEFGGVVGQRERTGSVATKLWHFFFFSLLLLFLSNPNAQMDHGDADGGESSRVKVSANGSRFTVHYDQADLFAYESSTYKSNGVIHTTYHRGAEKTRHDIAVGDIVVCSFCLNPGVIVCRVVSIDPNTNEHQSVVLGTSDRYADYVSGYPRGELHKLDLCKVATTHPTSGPHTIEWTVKEAPGLETLPVDQVLQMSRDLHAARKAAEQAKLAASHLMCSSCASSECSNDWANRWLLVPGRAGINLVKVTSSYLGESRVDGVHRTLYGVLHGEYWSWEQAQHNLSSPSSLRLVSVYRRRLPANGEHPTEGWGIRACDLIKGPYQLLSDEQRQAALAAVAACLANARASAFDTVFRRMFSDWKSASHERVKSKAAFTKCYAHAYPGRGAHEQLGFYDLTTKQEAVDLLWTQYQSTVAALF